MTLPIKKRINPELFMDIMGDISIGVGAVGAMHLLLEKNCRNVKASVGMKDSLMHYLEMTLEEKIMKCKFT